MFVKRFCTRERKKCLSCFRSSSPLLRWPRPMSDGSTVVYVVAVKCSILRFWYKAEPTQRPLQRVGCDQCVLYKMYTILYYTSFQIHYCLPEQNKEMRGDANDEKHKGASPKRSKVKWRGGVKRRHVQKGTAVRCTSRVCHMV